jgi:hypothetical protein
MYFARSYQTTLHNVPENSNPQNLHLVRLVICLLNIAKSSLLLLQHARMLVPIHEVVLRLARFSSRDSQVSYILHTSFPGSWSDNYS